ncbi:Na/Pi symporter [Natroniella sulfidigena]|uniref:Na/Pi cotransporter family protein n=1 Tax=Natroniella sulfidigena TaxID=723921 RepID=UPI00200B9B9D|nr:Na/Pi symporter [Natroniella sulfidigena]MCK8817997.1 Na/Pi symporter [Natroniella sulfidigena]
MKGVFKLLAISITQLLGGLSLFWFGMQLVKDSFYQAAGDNLERIMRLLTINTLASIVTGTLITMVIQSSSATSVLIVSLVNANLLSLEQAFGVIMGANIGTTVTIQLLSFQLEDYLWLITLSGLLIYFLYLITKRRFLKYIARGVLGFSILFVGLELMALTMTSFKEAEWFINLLAKSTAVPMVGIILGIIITALIQSSSALTGVIIVLAKLNLISLPLAITLSLGSNIGTCITGVLAGVGSSQAAKQTAWGQVLFNVVGVVAILPILPLFIQLVRETSTSLPRQIANAHTIFNIYNVVIVLPVKGLFIKAIVNLAKD